jgi:hypothetical protein
MISRFAEMKMTFYRNTRIEYWQSRSQSALRLAFEESRKRHSLSRGDRELPKFKHGLSLLAVNPFSRRIWGEAISNEVSTFFCAGGDGTTHDQDVYFVSLMDLGCARSLKEYLTDSDMAVIKQRLRYGLRGLSYIGMIEPAYYVNLQAGTRFNDVRCLFWHLHALVWGTSRKELKGRFRRLVKDGRYTSIADGLKATHSRRIRQGRLPAHVAYLVKSPSKAYRVSARDRVDRRGQPVTDSDGVILRQFKQGKAKLRHGERITIFHAMKHLYLDRLAVAGGEGVGLLKRAKLVALTECSLYDSRRTPGPVARRRRRKSRD